MQMAEALAAIGRLNDAKRAGRVTSVEQIEQHAVFGPKLEEVRKAIDPMTIAFSNLQHAALRGVVDPEFVFPLMFKDKGKADYYCQLIGEMRQLYELSGVERGQWVYSRAVVRELLVKFPEGIEFVGSSIEEMLVSSLRSTRFPLLRAWARKGDREEPTTGGTPTDNGGGAPPAAPAEDPLKGIL